MPSLGLAENHPRRNVRLDTLVRLRWLAIIGQTTAVLVVYYGLDFTLPIWTCLAVIALSASLNVALRLRFHMTQRLEPDRAAWLLAFDIAELAVLLFLTGGLQNPFAFLFLGPVLISATALPARMTLMLAGFGILAATEIVLTREQHLTQLDGLAAAAAHELGTPLSTIALVARELEKALGDNSPHVEDVSLLREQVQRCGDILGKLSQLPGPGEPFERMNLSALIEEVVAPHRNFGVAIDVVTPTDAGDEPVVARNPAIMYGLGNLVENAIDFARERIELAAEWSGDKVTVTINDDGPGFPPEIMDRLGAPLGTRRRPGAPTRSRSPSMTTTRAFRPRSWTGWASPSSPAGASGYGRRARRPGWGWA